MRDFFAAILLVILGTVLTPSASSAQSTEIEWTVQNPFRFYKRSGPFQLHEKAYKAVRGAPESPIPANIIQLVERCLNDPASAAFPAAAACADLSHDLLTEDKREGWAARTLKDVCYDRGKREYPVTCEREHGAVTKQEDYILPQSHAIEIGLSASVPAGEKNGDCEWQWSERGDPSKKTKKQVAACKEKITIGEVPFAQDQTASGIAITVKLASGRVIPEQEIVVHDRLVVSLGDSFSSGEGNPDVPVKFSRTASMEYNPQRPSGGVGAGLSLGSLPSTVAGRTGSSYLLPRRQIESDTWQGNKPDQGSDEFVKEFWEKSAKWLSADCHRSQYGYPVRVALQLALEDRHRAITFAHLGCSGAEVTDGLLDQMNAREGNHAELKVTAQLAQLTDLLCREDAPKSPRTFTLTVFNPGAVDPYQKSFTFESCKGKLKRPIDVMMLSIGGNDVGFSALGAYVILDNLKDIGWVAGSLDKAKRFGPDIAGEYLKVLDQRIQALKVALEKDFAVPPSKIIHTSYERIQDNETGELCGANANLGMDVHSKFSFHVEHLKQTARFLGSLLVSLQCMTDKAKAESELDAQGKNIKCPSLKTGDGTKFTLVTKHQDEFRKRGICARGPGDGDGVLMRMPRDDVGEFKPYNPADFRPYASRTRLFRTPNDAFLTANMHYNGHSWLTEPPIDDRLQPAFAALYSGAIHPTAQAHATVADYVVKEAREILKRDSQ
jgi:hypothetical protein